MFKHALIPFDGSKLAESVLPIARFLAQKIGFKMTLFHIMEEHPPKDVHGEAHLRNYEEAQSYLKNLVEKSMIAGVDIDCHVHKTSTDNVASGIVDHISELNPDLIIMCVHGGKDLKRTFFGSIAQTVFLKGGIHVLTVPATTRDLVDDFKIKRIMVLLDGDKEHDKGVCSAAEIARKTSSMLDLILVVPTVNTLSGGESFKRSIMPGATKVLLDMSESNLKSYLSEIAKKIEVGSGKVSFEILRGDPLRIVLDKKKKNDYDLLVFGSHGKKGFDAFFDGSKGSRLLNESELPILLVPILKEQH